MKKLNIKQFIPYIVLLVIVGIVFLTYGLNNKNWKEMTYSELINEFAQGNVTEIETSEHKSDGNEVTLMTMHSAKGLEFDAVFLVGMEENIFPHSQSLMEEGGIEEERRLCYVGVTRAKKKLFLTNAKRRMLYGKETLNAPSRFIDEINKDYLDIVNPMLEEPKKVNKSEYYDSESKEYKKGDMVMHQILGRGVIVDVDDTLVSVAFIKAGLRKVQKSYKGMKVVK